MARIDPPPDGVVLFDHQPEQYAAFNELYGELWSDGAVDEATKEVGRLRNAFVVDCAL